MIKNFVLYINSSCLFKLQIYIFVLFLYWVFDAYTGEVLHCSGNVVDISDSDSDISNNNESNQITDLSIVRENLNRTRELRFQLEILRNSCIISMRNLAGGRGHSRSFRQYRQITAQIDSLIRTENAFNRQARRIINRNIGRG